MCNESAKTRAVRGDAFYTNYLSGKIIDIGCGSDPVTANAEPFDLEHGDAQIIASLRPGQAYDAVHSSHCLEHMRDPAEALRQWWALVKPGGYLVIVVPDEALYEQGIWPSIFNADHKSAFRIVDEAGGNAGVYDLRSLVGGLPQAEIISCEIQSRGYRMLLRTRGISPLGQRLYTFKRRLQVRLERMRLDIAPLRLMIDGLGVIAGVPVDQTLGGAMAQIQIVARKVLPSA